MLSVRSMLHVRTSASRTCAEVNNHLGGGGVVQDLGVEGAHGAHEVVVLVEANEELALALTLVRRGCGLGVGRAAFTVANHLQPSTLSRIITRTTRTTTATSNKQQEEEEQHQQTTNNKQQTTNNKQQTTNNKQ